MSYMLCLSHSTTRPSSDRFPDLHRELPVNTAHDDARIDIARIVVLDTITLSGAQPPTYHPPASIQQPPPPSMPSSKPRTLPTHHIYKTFLGHYAWLRLLEHIRKHRIQSVRHTDGLCVTHILHVARDRVLTYGIFSHIFVLPFGARVCFTPRKHNKLLYEIRVMVRYPLLVHTHIRHDIRETLLLCSVC